MMYFVEPATQYVVSVRAFNDIDKGPVIYDLVYTASNEGIYNALHFFYELATTFVRQFILLYCICFGTCIAYVRNSLVTSATFCTIDHKKGIN